MAFRRHALISYATASRAAARLHISPASQPLPSPPRRHDSHAATLLLQLMPAAAPLAAAACAISPMPLIFISEYASAIACL